ncbi:MAG TPA: glycosyltransferase family A protein [Capillimicrobium sp.]|nr:glycosyltransferase family A protein [Capillimicrobium sp.]
MTPASAPTASLLRPAWDRPATWLPQLGRHLAAGDGHVLHLDATEAGVPPSVVQAMLVEACGALAPDASLHGILIHDDPAELAAYADLPAPELPDELDDPDAARTLERAVAVKRIADAARARIDRWRFEHAAAPIGDRPLVSVRIPTWRGRETLVSRTLPSVLNGDYENIEVIVCSDGPEPDTREAVEAVARRDPRVRYLELPERPRYPAAKINLHRIGGTAAANATIEAARGAFQCPLDHDDAFTYDHIVTLLRTAAASGADFVYGQSVCEMERGIWGVNGVAPLRHGGLSHGAVMWSSRLAHMRYDADAWLLREPGDWNMFRRMVEAGSKASFIPTAVLVHFAERTAIDSVDVVPPEPGSEEALADLRATDGAWLLHVPVASPELRP